ncbi:MAG: FecR domain-containing protein [Novosphingobium sp.]
MTVLKDIDERRLDEALAWLAALEHNDADWDAYTSWLEADPRNCPASDEMALTARIVEDNAETLRRLRAVEPRRVRQPRRARLFGGVGAAVALIIGVLTLWPKPDSIFETRQGESREFALSEGVRVALAPATRLIARHGDASSLELARGDAYFVVAHDPNRPLTITVADHAVSDIGTTFGVNLTARAVSVSVAEGTVSVASKAGDATSLAAGQQLIAMRDGSAMRVRPIAAENVGSWRKGRLVYNQTAIDIVIADISRYSGATITLDPAVRDRPFSGVLVIGDGRRMLANLAELTGLAFEIHGDRARIGASSAR